MTQRRSTQPKLSSIDRALTIVEYLANQGNTGASLADISSYIRANKATVHHTLAALRKRNWVDQDSSTGYYYLSNGIDPIVKYRTRCASIVHNLRPALVAITHRFNELTHLGRLVDENIEYLDKVEPDRPIRVVSAIGRRSPAVRTALGRALLASMKLTPEQVNWYLDATIPNPYLRRRFTEEIHRVHQSGWAEELEENEKGIACVAVPIQFKNGEIVAVSVTAPIERMLDAQHRKELAFGIAEEVHKLDARLAGYVPSVLI
ncbi:IclR family transcriptional regulator [Actinotignum urinale]|uniref:IclR family transcriptional regulator n=1 Tax=Actinotignum urinale TaxID=190146 RepID=UPI002A810F05|nr:IclR family transcriptional regulator [Actinotignum urinale]MDY5128825.1 IclR family transcriptional regulator [Actinotignum urinale]